MESKDSSDAYRPFSWTVIRPFLIAAIGAPLVVALIYVLNFSGGLSEEHDAWGQFGDYFGGLLNPIFGLLSFVALLLALVLQSRELHASMQELRASTDALESQHEALKRQSFENTFFQMLRRVGEIIGEMSHGNLAGRKALDLVYQSLHGRLRNAVENGEDIGEAYENFYEDFGNQLGHYFRSLYHVFTLIDRAALSYDEKAVYANIARAQLSDVELVLLFYNGITGEGAKGFKPLIERYGLLKHVRRRMLLDEKHKLDSEFYPETAFFSLSERKEFWGLEKEDALTKKFSS